MKKLVLLVAFSAGFWGTPLALAQLEDAKGTSASKAVEYLADEGIIEGYSDGTFKPEKEINRAEFLKIVLKAGNLVKEGCEKGSRIYSDVERKHWFYNVICSATEAGIVEGYPDGSFRPGDPIKFSEASKIVAKVNELDTEVTDTTEPWYQQFIRALQGHKVVAESIETFGQKLNRGEMAQMIWGLQTGNDVDNAELGELPKITSCKDLSVQMERYQKRQGPQRNQFFGGRVNMLMEDFAEAEVSTVPQAAMARSESAKVSSDSSTGVGAGGASNYSTTNVQEFGVDEADIIKNDGKYIYMIRNNTIRIVEAYPATELKQVANFTVDNAKNFWAREMYVDNGILTVVGGMNEYVNYDKPVPLPVPEPFLEDEVFPTQLEKEAPLDDILESLDMKSLGEVEFVDPPSNEVALAVAPGRGYLYPGGTNKQFTVVASFDVSDPENQAPQIIRKVSVEGNYTNSRKIGDMVYLVTNKYQNYWWGRPMPVFSETDLPVLRDSASSEEKMMIVPCHDIYYFPNFEQPNYLIVAAINTKDIEQKVGRTMMLGSGEELYASGKNLYVTRTQHRERFIQNRTWDGWHYEPLTEIYKFALKGNDIEFTAKGSVPGRILNQFSMSEAESGHFRIATQLDQEGSRMNILDSGLKMTGFVDGIAPGESIKSVRFMGQKGYMVTFKHVDPLFVLDLDPNNPKVLGELKIPGWSDYLHPYDENHLIGLGKEVKEGAEEDDRLTSDEVLGLKISIFDVSDVTNPRETHKKIIGDTGTYSEVLNNHKAFLFDKREGILGLPISVMAKDGPAKNNYQPTKQVYNGAFVYDIDLDDGFTLRGKVTHYTDDYWSEKGTRRHGNHEYNVQRIIYIGDHFYTISPNVIEAHTWDDLNEVARTELDEKACNQIYDELECKNQSQCKTIWREWSECYESDEDFSKICEEQKQFLRCENR